MWLVYPSASASDSTIWFSLDHKRRRHKGSRMKTETFWFFRFWFRRACSPPITTPSVVKTNLNITQARSSGYLWDIKHVLPNIEWKKPRHPEAAFSNYREMQFHWTRNNYYFKIVTFGESRNEGCRNMLSSGTAGRGTLLLLTITLVCRRGKYGPRSPEIMWQHLINVQPSCGLLLIPLFVFLEVLTSL